MQLLKDNNKLKITEKEVTLGDLRQKQEDQIASSQPIIDGFDGLMARINAIGELAWFPSFFILLLFLAIETAPVLAKLLAPKGAYDLKFQDQEDALLVWVTQQQNQRAELLKTDISLNEKVYYDVAEDEETYAYKKQKAKELMQLQSDVFFKNQKEIMRSH